MTPTDLADGVATFLKELHHDYRATDARVKDNELIVSPGFMKLKEKASEDQFPHIVVRINTVEDTESESMCTLLIIFGTYCEDVNDGWKEITNFVEATRQALLKYRYIDKKFRLELPLKTEIPAEQPYPMWVGMITANYTLRQVREELIY